MNSPKENFLSFCFLLERQLKNTNNGVIYLPRLLYNVSVSNSYVISSTVFSLFFLSINYSDPEFTNSSSSHDQETLRSSRFGGCEIHRARSSLAIDRGKEHAQIVRLSEDRSSKREAPNHERSTMENERSKNNCGPETVNGEEAVSFRER